MKKYYLITFLYIGIILLSCATSKKNTTNGNKGLTQELAASGIKEVLNQGLLTAITNLSKPNSFINNQQNKIGLPPLVANVESTLLGQGYASDIENAKTALNKIAESVIVSASPVFTSQINAVQIDDALLILKGQKNAATEYCKNQINNTLLQAIIPEVKKSINNASGLQNYNDFIKKVNNMPTTKTWINPDPTNFIAVKVIDVLFDNIANEEALIRENPNSRKTVLLKKVFGVKW